MANVPDTNSNFYVGGNRDYYYKWNKDKKGNYYRTFFDKSGKQVEQSVFLSKTNAVIDKNNSMRVRTKKDKNGQEHYVKRYYPGSKTGRFYIYKKDGTKLYYAANGVPGTNQGCIKESYFMAKEKEAVEAAKAKKAGKAPAAPKKEDNRPWYQKAWGAVTDTVKEVATTVSDTVNMAGEIISHPGKALSGAINVVKDIINNPGAYGEGIVNAAKSMVCDESGHFSIGRTLKTLATCGAIVAACAVGGPAVMVAVTAYFAAHGATTMYNNAKALQNAKTEEEKNQARQNIGGGAFETATAVLGAKGLKGKFKAARTTFTDVKLTARAQGHGRIVSNAKATWAAVKTLKPSTEEIKATWDTVRHPKQTFDAMRARRAAKAEIKDQVKAATSREDIAAARQRVNESNLSESAKAKYNRKLDKASQDASAESITRYRTEVEKAQADAAAKPESVDAAKRLNDAKANYNKAVSKSLNRRQLTERETELKNKTTRTADETAELDLIQSRLKEIETQQRADFTQQIENVNVKKGNWAKRGYRAARRRSSDATALEKRIKSEVTEPQLQKELLKKLEAKKDLHKNIKKTGKNGTREDYQKMIDEAVKTNDEAALDMIAKNLMKRKRTPGGRKTVKADRVEMLQEIVQKKHAMHPERFPDMTDIASKYRAEHDPQKFEAELKSLQGEIKSAGKKRIFNGKEKSAKRLNEAEAKLNEIEESLNKLKEQKDLTDSQLSKVEHDLDLVEQRRNEIRTAREKRGIEVKEKAKSEKTGNTEANKPMDADAIAKADKATLEARKNAIENEIYERATSGHDKVAKMSKEELQNEINHRVEATKNSDAQIADITNQGLIRGIKENPNLDIATRNQFIQELESVKIKDYPKETYVKYRIGDDATLKTEYDAINERLGKLNNEAEVVSAETPKTEAPKTEEPKAETETPKAEEPKAEAEVPKAEEPKAEIKASNGEGSKAETKNDTNNTSDDVTVYRKNCTDHDGRSFDSEFHNGEETRRVYYDKDGKTVVEVREYKNGKEISRKDANGNDIKPDVSETNNVEAQQESVPAPRSAKDIESDIAKIDGNTPKETLNSIADDINRLPDGAEKINLTRAMAEKISEKGLSGRPSGEAEVVNVEATKGDAEVVNVEIEPKAETNTGVKSRLDDLPNDSILGPKEPRMRETVRNELETIKTEKDLNAYQEKIDSKIGDDNFRAELTDMVEQRRAQIQKENAAGEAEVVNIEAPKGEAEVVNVETEPKAETNTGVKSRLDDLPNDSILGPKEPRMRETVHNELETIKTEKDLNAYQEKIDSKIGDDNFRAELTDMVEQRRAQIKNETAAGDAEVVNVEAPKGEAEVIKAETAPKAEVEAKMSDIRERLDKAASRDDFNAIRNDIKELQKTNPNEARELFADYMKKQREFGSDIHRHEIKNVYKEPTTLKEVNDQLREVDEQIARTPDPESDAMYDLEKQRSELIKKRDQFQQKSEIKTDENGTKYREEVNENGQTVYREYLNDEGQIQYSRDYDPVTNNRTRETHYMNGRTNEIWEYDSKSGARTKSAQYNGEGIENIYEYDPKNPGYEKYSQYFDGHLDHEWVSDTKNNYYSETIYHKGIASSKNITRGVEPEADGTPRYQAVKVVQYDENGAVSTYTEFECSPGSTIKTSSITYDASGKALYKSKYDAQGENIIENTYTPEGEVRFEAEKKAFQAKQQKAKTEWQKIQQHLKEINEKLENATSIKEVDDIVSNLELNEFERPIVEVKVQEAKARIESETSKPQSTSEAEAKAKTEAEAKAKAEAEAKAKAEAEAKAKAEAEAKAKAETEAKAKAEAEAKAKAETEAKAKAEAEAKAKAETEVNAETAPRAEVETAPRAEVETVTTTPKRSFFGRIKDRVEARFRLSDVRKAQRLKFENQIQDASTPADIVSIKRQIENNQYLTTRAKNRLFDKAEQKALEIQNEAQVINATPASDAEVVNAETPTDAEVIKAEVETAPKAEVETAPKAEVETAPKANATDVLQRLDDIEKKISNSKNLAERRKFEAQREKLLNNNKDVLHDYYQKQLSEAKTPQEIEKIQSEINNLPKSQRKTLNQDIKAAQDRLNSEAGETQTATNEPLKNYTDEGGNTHTCDYDANGHRTHEVVKDSEGNVIESVDYKYDGDNMTQTVFKDKNGNVTETQDYTFDKQNNLAKETVKDKNGNITESREYEYDANHNQTKETVTDKQGNVTEYDGQGHKTHEVTKDADGNVVESAEYKYDGDNMTQAVFKDKNGNVTETQNYTFDKQNNLAKETVKDKNGNITETREYEYDANHNLTKETVTNKQGNVTEYDGQGNKVSEHKATTTEPANKPTEEVKPADKAEENPTNTSTENEQQIQSEIESLKGDESIKDMDALRERIDNVKDPAVQEKLNDALRKKIKDLNKARNKAANESKLTEEKPADEVKPTEEKPVEEQKPADEVKPTEEKPVDEQKPAEEAKPTEPEAEAKIPSAGKSRWGALGTGALWLMNTGSTTNSDKRIPEKVVPPENDLVPSWDVTEDVDESQNVDETPTATDASATDNDTPTASDSDASATGASDNGAAAGGAASTGGAATVNTPSAEQRANDAVKSIENQINNAKTLDDIANIRKTIEDNKDLSKQQKDDLMKKVDKKEQEILAQQNKPDSKPDDKPDGKTDDTPSDDKPTTPTSGFYIKNYISGRDASGNKRDITPAERAILTDQINKAKTLDDIALIYSEMGSYNRFDGRRNLRRALKQKRKEIEAQMDNNVQAENKAKDKFADRIAQVNADNVEATQGDNSVAFEGSTKDLKGMKAVKDNNIFHRLFRGKQYKLDGELPETDIGNTKVDNTGDGDGIEKPKHLDINDGIGSDGNDLA